MKKGTKGLPLTSWLTQAEVAEYRLILEAAGVPDSDANVQALARLAAKNAHFLPHDFIFEQMGEKGKYPEQARELARLSREIAKVREEYYPEEKKYQDPPRIKLLRAINDLQAVLAMRTSGEEIAREVVLYELANVLYHNASDWLQDHDIRSHDAVVDLFTQKAGEPPETALSTAIAKYQCHLAHKDLKYREPERAREMELEAIREAMN